MKYITEVRIAELIVVVILVAYSLSGYHKGLLRTLFDMVRLILIAVIALFLAPIVVEFLPRTVSMRYGIAYFGSFVVATIVLGVVSHVLGIVDKIPVVKQLNHIVGGILGLFVGFLILWIAFMIVGTFQSLDWCIYMASLIKESKLLMFIQECNPILKILY